MNKVAAYLSEHILGEVSTDARLIKTYSRDGGLLEMSPEMVVFPRQTNDIRKIARFSWQLADKNHKLPITARGHGMSTNGSAIGKGVMLSTIRYMNQVFEYDAKQKLVRLQPGARLESVQAALRLHGTGLAAVQDASYDSTIGGLVASNYRGSFSAKYGDVNSVVDQLEVVLSSGDVLQTGRISKRELNRKKGLQTLEGEIYRNVDNLLEDHGELIASLGENDAEDMAGYAGISEVKRRDGSFDLTPLFIGSEGTLGIISEMILRTEFMSVHRSVTLLIFDEKADARDATEHIRKLQPAFADYLDGELFVEAAKNGKKFDWLNSKNEKGAVIVVGFDDFNDRARNKKTKKLVKIFEPVATIVSANDEEAEPLMAARDVTNTVYASRDTVTWPALGDGFYIPENRLEEFSSALAELGAKNHQTLAMHGHVLSGIYSCRPALHLSRVGDKQKVFKILNELSDLIEKHGGYMAGAHSEGRLIAKFTYKSMDDEQKEVISKIRSIFDPHHLLNPGVKEEADLKTLVSLLSKSH